MPEGIHLWAGVEREGLRRKTSSSYLRGGAERNSGGDPLRVLFLKQEGSRHDNQL